MLIHAPIADVKSSVLRMQSKKASVNLASLQTDTQKAKFTIRRRNVTINGTMVAEGIDMTRVQAKPRANPVAYFVIIFFILFTFFVLPSIEFNGYFLGSWRTLFWREDLRPFYLIVFSCMCCLLPLLPVVPSILFGILGGIIGTQIEPTQALISELRKVLIDVETRYQNQQPD